MASWPSSKPFKVADDDISPNEDAATFARNGLGLRRILFYVHDNGTILFFQCENCNQLPVISLVSLSGTSPDVTIIGLPPTQHSSEIKSTLHGVREFKLGYIHNDTV